MKKVLVFALMMLSFMISLSCSPESLENEAESYGPGIEPMGIDEDKGPMVDPVG